MEIPLDKAISAASGVTRLGELLGVGQTTVSNWRSRGVPLDRCADIERATGVRCEQLRGDVTWVRDESGQVTHYQVRVMSTTPPPHAAEQKAA
jgi:DNA-binding transcriptional regulator YdaS (Cro superfamily)